MKLVLVEWIDSGSVHSWTSIDSLKKHNIVPRCRTVGWLVCKGRDCTTFAATLSNEHGDNPFATGDITIPNSCIKKITILRRNG